MEKLINNTIESFCTARGCTKEDVLGSNATSYVCQTRYMIYAYLHNNKKISGYELSKVFSRTRINILRGIRLLRNHMKYHKEICTEFNSIVETIEGGH